MSHWSADHAVPFVLLSLLALLEVYANRLRRAGVASGDRGTLFIVMLLVGGGYWAGQFGMHQQWQAGGCNHGHGLAQIGCQRCGKRAMPSGQPIAAMASRSP